MDGVLCDYSLPMFGDKAKRDTTMTKSARDAEIYARLFLKNRTAADKFFAKCMGQDASMDDETVEKLKAFCKASCHPRITRRPAR